MAKFIIPVSWTFIDNMEIEAATLDEAIEKANSSETPLPDDGAYLEDSFKVDMEMVNEINTIKRN